jgi:formate/nitrite transporter FocA (FNT family)
MAQGAWLILSTPTGSSQILCIYIVTFIIGIAGLHHSIAGSAELFVAMLQHDSITLAAVAHCLLFAVLGNAVGGSIFVAILNYAHIRKYWQE